MNAKKFLKNFKKASKIRNQFTQEIQWVLNQYPKLKISHLSNERVTFFGKKIRDTTTFSILISICIIENEIQCIVFTRINRNQSDEETQMESAKTVKKALSKFTQ